MDDLSPSDLKTILHSKRANLYYLEHCRVLVNGGRVEYVTDEGRQSRYWNIPIANTTSLLLGTGTSITQAAMRELAKAGVLVGFCGGSGTPLFAATDVELDIAWLNPQSEYRPTEYLQHWVSFWFFDDQRHAAAQQFQLTRLTTIERCWQGLVAAQKPAFNLSQNGLAAALAEGKRGVEDSRSGTELLAEEARLTKRLYKLAVDATGYGEFSRIKQGAGNDPANRYLDHGNYLAYGLAATAAWVLGLPHGLAILHGKTRRGGLVFDIADLVKDALVLPQAFLSAMAGEGEQEFRQQCIARFRRADALDIMIDTVKSVATRCSRVGL